MPSIPSRDDLEAALWSAGIKDPQKMRRLLHVVDQYAYGLSRKSVVLEEAVVTEEVRGRKYLCRNCGERYPIKYFPLEKQADHSLPYDCVGCGGTDRHEYKCPDCGLPKPIAEYPEGKRKDPHLRVACNWCQPRRITKNDAGYVRNR